MRCFMKTSKSWLTRAFIPLKDVSIDSGCHQCLSPVHDTTLQPKNDRHTKPETGIRLFANHFWGEKFKRQCHKFNVLFIVCVQRYRTLSFVPLPSTPHSLILVIIPFRYSLSLPPFFTSVFTISCFSYFVSFLLHYPAPILSRSIHLRHC